MISCSRMENREWPPPPCPAQSQSHPEQTRNTSCDQWGRKQGMTTARPGTVCLSSSQNGACLQCLCVTEAELQPLESWGRVSPNLLRWFRLCVRAWLTHISKTGVTGLVTKDTANVVSREDCTWGGQSKIGRWGKSAKHLSTNQHIGEKR